MDDEPERVEPEPAGPATARNHAATDGADIAPGPAAAPPAPAAHHTHDDAAAADPIYREAADAAATGGFLWRAPQPWEDLTGRSRAVGAVTAVTVSGAARLIDLRRGFHWRLPFEGGHRLPGDTERLRYDVATITPCGVTLAHYDASFSTRLWALLPGFDDQWTRRADCRDIVDAIVAKIVPDIVGHPPEPCNALHCIRQQPS